MIRTGLAAALCTLLATAAPAAAAGWALQGGKGVASLAYGPDGAAGSVRFECAGGKTQLSTWVRKPPRNTAPGAFSTQVRLFQGRTELVFAANGTVVAGQPVTRIDAGLPDPVAVLEGARANGRLVLVSYAGRTTAPAPTQTDIAGFSAACAAHPGS